MKMFVAPAETLRCDLLTPAPDGTLTAFVTPVAYRPGSVAVWQNGLLMTPDRYTATDGTSIVMNVAPWLGDSLQAEYIPA